MSQSIKITGLHLNLKSIIFIQENYNALMIVASLKYYKQ